MSTLFDTKPGPAEKPAKRGKPANCTPPAGWVVRQLVGHGVKESDAKGMDAKAAFARLEAIEAARDARGLPLGADDPACQGPDGWPLPLRLSLAADLLADLETPGTSERLMGSIESALPATTRAERVRIVHGLARMLGGHLAARPPAQEKPMADDHEISRLHDDGNPHHHDELPAARPGRCASCDDPLDTPDSGVFCLACACRLEMPDSDGGEL